MVGRKRGSCACLVRVLVIIGGFLVGYVPVCVVIPDSWWLSKLVSPNMPMLMYGTANDAQGTAHFGRA